VPSCASTIAQVTYNLARAIRFGQTNNCTRVREKYSVVSVPRLDGSVIVQIRSDDIEGFKTVLGKEILPVSEWPFVDVMLPPLTHRRCRKQDEITMANKRGNETL
jgi:hypothetical protein